MADVSAKLKRLEELHEVYVQDMQRLSDRQRTLLARVIERIDKQRLEKARRVFINDQEK